MATKALKKKPLGLVRSLKINVFITDKDLKKKIVGSIREYRATLRKLYAATALSEIAGAEITIKDDNLFVKPDKKSATVILAEAFNGSIENKSDLYQLREFHKELNPTWMSFVGDSARNTISSQWKAKDSLIKATKGWLVDQGARALARFMHIGISIPQQAGPKMEAHKFTVKWDHAIGSVEFTISRLDSSSYYIWKCLRDGEPGWVPRTVYLNECDGELYIVQTYLCPEKEVVLDQANQMIVEFTEDPTNYITMHGPKAFSGDIINVEEVLGWLKELECITASYKKRMASAGSPGKSWGYKTAFKAIATRLSNNTERRSNGVKTRNHLWTRRIVENATRFGCGTIVVNNMPKQQIFSEPWGWYQFESMLKYKIEELGGKLLVQYAKDKEA